MSTLRTEPPVSEQGVPLPAADPREARIQGSCSTPAKTPTGNTDAERRNAKGTDKTPDSLQLALPGKQEEMPYPQRRTGREQNSQEPGRLNTLQSKPRCWQKDGRTAEEFRPKAASRTTREQSKRPRLGFCRPASDPQAFQVVDRRNHHRNGSQNHPKAETGIPGPKAHPRDT